MDGWMDVDTTQASSDFMIVQLESPFGSDGHYNMFQNQLIQYDHLHVYNMMYFKCIKAGIFVTQETIRRLFENAGSPWSATKIQEST